MICSTKFVSKHGDICDILSLTNKPLAHLALPAHSTALIEARAGSLTLSNMVYASLTTYDIFSTRARTRPYLQRKDNPFSSVVYIAED
jgi:hypothetical protein